MRRILYLVVTTMLFVGCSQKNNPENKESKNDNSKKEEVQKKEEIELKYANYKTDMYPEVKDGYKQFIIKLPVRENEYDLEVEIYTGEDMEVDCNNHSLTEKLEEKDIPGWGYTYWEFPNEYRTVSTARGCPDENKRTLFVQSPPVKTRYNSKLPIIIYVPEKMKVKYSIWNKNNAIQDAELMSK